MLRNIRETLVLILLALLPFHAFFVTVVTRAVAGPGHAPLGILALWKEAVLAVILIIAIIELLRSLQRSRDALGVDLIDITIIAMIVLSVIVTTLTHADVSLYLLGFRYDFIPLVAFLLLRRVAWSKAFKAVALQLLLMVGVVVAGYALVALLLPASFFTFIGYSDLHSLYLPGRPIAFAQYIESLDIMRAQGTFSGPNQLGLWLLIPWMISLENIRTQPKCRVSWICAFIIGAAVLCTFSRAAWLASGVVMLALLAQWRAWKPLLLMIVFASIVAGSLVYVAPSVVLRATTSDHIEKPMEAVIMMIEHPFGRGLGTAGPASNRVSDACVFLPGGSDTAWAADRQELCVFVGNQQIQPANRTCTCPFLTENWYLQLGVELGWLGFMLMIALTVLAITRLPMIPVFAGVAIAALVLHAWEDSALSYTVWMMAASMQFPGVRFRVSEERESN